MPVDRTKFAGQAKPAPTPTPASAPAAAPTPAPKTEEEEKPKKRERKEPAEPREPKEPKIKQEDLTALEKRMAEQFEKKLQDEMLKIKIKERECVDNDARLRLLKTITSSWEEIKKSELSKWAQPKVEGKTFRGSSRAVTFVEQLDQFIKDEIEKALKIKKACEGS